MPELITKSLSELTKSSWSLQTLAQFIFIAKEFCSGNTELAWLSRETQKNILFRFLTFIFNILSILKFSRWSSIRIWKYLKPYIYISGMIGLPS